MAEIDNLLQIIHNISSGQYSDDIMSLTGPETPEPIRTIAEAMGLMMVKVEAREYHLEMLVAELKSLNEKIRENTIKTVSTMANALAARDPYTQGHTDRVGHLAEQIATEMGLDAEQIEFIRLGGLLHDIGKIGFPDHLFMPHQAKNPPEIVKRIVQHPAVGADILKDLDFLGPAIEYVHSHHERPDGKGYPRRLKNAEIVLGAKIIAVADAFDAMTTDRPYQKAKTTDEALEIMKKLAGSQWDPQCVHALDSCLTRPNPQIPIEPPR